MSTGQNPPDVVNAQMVGGRGDRIIVRFPNVDMSRHAALVHAAWLVTLAEIEDGEFERYLQAVRNT